jgi:hypothetical protein
MEDAPDELVEVPRQYEFCDVDHVVLLVSDIIVETAAMNDLAPPREAGMTLFHSLYAPSFVHSCTRRHLSGCRHGHGHN